MVCQQNDTDVRMKLTYPVFDFHVHLYPDHLAGKAVGQLAGRFGNSPAFDGTVDGLRADLATSGIRGALNLPVATRPDQVASINTWAAAHNDGVLAGARPRARSIPPSALQQCRTPPDPLGQRGPVAGSMTIFVASVEEGL